MQTPWILYGAGGPTNPPEWLGTPSQLIDFAVMRELCLGMTVTSSLPDAGHQAPRRAHPKQQLSMGTLGEDNHVMELACIANKFSSSNQQLVNWGCTTAHRGVTQGVCSSFRPRCSPSDAQHICVLEQCCPDVHSHLAWWLSKKRCQRLLLLCKQVAVGRPEVCKSWAV